MIHTLFVTTELAPYAGTGARADIARALSKAVRGLDHRVTVFAPLPAGADPSKLSLARKLSGLSFTLGATTLEAELYDGRTAAGVDVAFARHPSLSPPPEGGEDRAQTLRRAHAFAQAALAYATSRDPKVDVLHVLDVDAALVSTLAKRADLAPVVLTLTDPRARITGTLADAEVAHLDPSLLSEDALLHRGAVDVLKGALLSADRITVPSTHQVRELAHEKHALGLEALFAMRGEAVSGLPLGVDASIWNPAIDAALARRFDAVDRVAKISCKAAAQNELGLPIRADVPLFLVPAAAPDSRVVEWLSDALPALLRTDVQVVVLGEFQGDARAWFDSLAGRFADRLAIRAFDDVTLHRFYGATDFVLDTSLHATTGLEARIAHRYGALPIAIHAGAHVDFLVDCDTALETGTAFTFHEPSGESLLGAARRAVAAFAQTEAFDRLRARVMRFDHSWERSARLADRIYKLLAAAS